jgi:hypothetical protein
MDASLRSPDDSTEPRDAERSALLKLGQLEGVEFEHLSLPLPITDGTARVEIDGFAAGPPPTLVDVYTHYGAVKGGQRHKLLADAMKLVTVTKVLKRFNAARIIIAVTDHPAEDYLSKGWAGAAIRTHNIKVVCVELDPDEVEVVKRAQRRQRMVNAGDGG